MGRSIPAKHLTIAAVSALALAVSSTALGQSYGVKELKPLAGGKLTVGNGINASGTLAGASSDKYGLGWATLWGAPNSAPNVWWGAGEENYFNSINGPGDTAGYTLFYNGGDPFYAPIVASGSQLSVLPTPGYKAGEAWCISDLFSDKTAADAYTVVGAVSTHLGADPAGRAAAWRRDGAMLLLKTLPGGDAFSGYNAAYSVDRFGLAGGSSAMNGQSVEQAVVWGLPSGDIVWWLNDPVRDNHGVGGAVRDVRDSWYFAGYYYPADFHTTHACYWDGQNTTHDLGALYGGSSAATAVRDHASTPNNRPEIVGWTDGNAGDYGHFPVAYVWDPVHGMRDLNTLIPANSGWHLDIANDVDPQGRIVGSGTLYGVMRGFVLTPIKIGKFPINPLSVVGGSQAQASITLLDEAPVDVTITLASSSASATAPRSVTIPRGQQTVRFAITTSPVRTTTTAVITATLGEQQTAGRMTITP